MMQAKRTMRNRVGMLAVALLLAAVTPGLLGAAEGGGDEEQLDVVYRTGHIPQPPILVVKDDWLVVTGEKGNFKPAYPSTSVEMIEWHNRSPRWNLAVVRIGQKNWAKALVNFRKMFDPTDKAYAVENPQVANCKWIADEGMYQYGMVLLKNGRAKDAAEAYMKSFEARQDGRYSLPALLGAADAYLQAGDTAKAKEVLEKFNAQLEVYLKAAREYRWPANMVGAGLACRDYADKLRLDYLYVQAKVLYSEAMAAAAAAGDGMPKIPPDAESACKEFVRKANIQLASVNRKLDQLDPTRARADYNELLGQWKDLDAQTTQVSNMLVDIRIAAKDFSGARSDCQKMIADYEKSRDPQLLSRLPAAYAGLGKVAFFEADDLRKRGDAIQAQKGFAKCRWYYQQVLVLYFDNTRYLQNALFYTGLCNEYLASVNIEKDAKQRAYDNFSRLAQMLSESDPLYKDVSAALVRTRPDGTETVTPAPPVEQ